MTAVVAVVGAAVTLFIRAVLSSCRNPLCPHSDWLPPAEIASKPNSDKSKPMQAVSVNQ
jgi:hypothetical protein